MDAKVWETTLKIAKELPNLQFLDKVINGEVVLPEVHAETSDTNETEKKLPESINGNPFEIRSKVIKERINGTTHQ